MGKNKPRTKLIFNTPARLLIFFFLITSSLALIVQFVILPLIFPALHAGHGLLINTDAPYFHRLASEMAIKIRLEGWSAWQWNPPDGAGMPVAIASLVYALTVSEPYTLIPLNAFIHALSALLIILITRLISKECTKNSPLVVWAGLPFLLLPSSASWYAQIHRDGYCFLGFFLVVHAWIRLLEAPYGKKFWKECSFLFLELFIGIILVWWARFYVLQLLRNFFICLLPIFSIYYISNWAKTQKRVLKLAMPLSFPLAAFLITLPFAKSGFDTNTTPIPNDELRTAEFKKEKQIWKDSGLPTSIERRLQQVAIKRDGSRYRPHPTEASHIDESIRFSSAIDIINYLPRAAQIAFLAPFPSMWFSKGATQAGTPMRAISSLEMIVIYSGIVFLFLHLGTLSKSFAFWIATIPSLGLLIVYTLGVNNLGAIYRYRYGYLMLLIGIGFYFLPKINEKEC